jgi:hypothetical protein
MGNSQSNIKINYEDIQYVIKNTETHVLINTLSDTEQACLIPTTINPKKEEELINSFIQTGNKQIKLVIYGKNCNDDKMYTKYTQLRKLGFYNIYMYTGGMFEWLTLQDIYGDKEFPTTKKELDLLRYKPVKVMNVHLLEY